jgi:hypothetical protein
LEEFIRPAFFTFTDVNGSKPGIYIVLFIIFAVKQACLLGSFALGDSSVSFGGNL